eukprot:676192_1
MMEFQFPLFERTEKKGINQPSQHVAPYSDCERLETSYKEYLHHCKRVKAQARLPNEILDTFQQQISSGMDTQIVLGLLYCILTNNNPSCNYPWEYLKDLTIPNKTLITASLSKLVDDYIIYITFDALNQIFWFLDVVLKSDYLGAQTNAFVTQTIVCIMRHIDVNRVTRYSLNLSQSVQKFIFNHTDWLVRLNKTKDRLFIHQVIYLFLRLIENHDHVDLTQSRKDEVRFVARLFDKFPDSWTGIGRDFIRLFQHLYPIESFTEYWGLIDNDAHSSKLVQILATPTDPLILQICISKQEQRDLVQLCADITIQTEVGVIKESIEAFVDKYLRRNKLAEHSCDIIRFIMSCYNQSDTSTNDANGLPHLKGKEKLLFHLLFYFFARTWKNEARSYIYEAMLMEVLYCKPSDESIQLNKPTCNSCDILGRVLEHGSTRQPDITANLMILVLETVRHYKTLPRGSAMRTLPHQSVLHFFKTSPQKCDQMMIRKDFTDKYQSLVQQFKREFDTLYSTPPSSDASPSPVKLEPALNVEDNVTNVIAIAPKKTNKSIKPIKSSANGMAITPIKPAFQAPNFQNEIEEVRERMDRMQKEQPFTLALFASKWKELQQPLTDYYTIKFIEMAQIKNEKQKRNLRLRMNELMKSIERYMTQLLNCYSEHVDKMATSKRQSLMETFAKGFVDMLAMDYEHCFILPDKMSSLWSILLEWCSKSCKASTNRSRSSEFEFDFEQNRIWLLKHMCSYQADVKYILLLYDSKTAKAKGFVKQLGVVQRKRKSSPIISRKLNAIHGWHKNQVEGVRINAHPHALLYGRRPFESIICDLCEKDWNGSSWHCSNNCDFDTCHDCFVQYLERKQLYRAVLYLRSKAAKKASKKQQQQHKMFYDDIAALQSKSCIVLSAIHQYLFYSYSCYIHPRVMDFIQIVLEVINPLQVQSLCKDIQLALFQLFDTDDIAYKLPKYIAASLRFPQYLQLSFWTLLNAFLRTRNNSDELYIRTLKHLAQLKRSYIHNVDSVNVWITSTTMNGLLDWTQLVFRSKRIDEIYDALLAFPTKAYDDEDDDEDDAIIMNNNELRSMSPSTTVFNVSSSSFDEFHIQALVQLLSLKSPRWKSWLQSKLTGLKRKYEKKQAEYENNDEYMSLNKARKRRMNGSEDIFQCTVSIERADEGYLLNLLKLYEYLTFVEPNIKDNAISVMANTFLYDADQRNILVRFLNHFSSLQHFLNELKEFWPPESSKSVSPKKIIKQNAIQSQQPSTSERIGALLHVNKRKKRTTHS